MDQKGEPIGYQILGPDGCNIHGDEDDPFDLHSFEILIDDAVEQARKWVAVNPGYKGYTVAPVYPDDVEEPEFVSWLREPSPKL